VEVQARQHDANIGVQRRAVGQFCEVFGLDIAAESGVGTADIGDAFCVEFLFDAGFANDEDFILWGGEFQYASDVYGGAVGGAKDFVLGVVSWFCVADSGRDVPLWQVCLACRTSSCSLLAIWCCCLLQRPVVCLHPVSTLVQCK
jgi:hypothetical protein